MKFQRNQPVVPFRFCYTYSYLHCCIARIGHILRTVKISFALTLTVGIGTTSLGQCSCFDGVPDLADSQWRIQQQADSAATHRAENFWRIANLEKYLRDLGTCTMVFTALQYAGGLSDRKGVRLSVRPSVCHSVNCDKTNESSAEILIPHER